MVSNNPVIPVQTPVSPAKPNILDKLKKLKGVKLNRNMIIAIAGLSVSLIAVIVVVIFLVSLTVHPSGNTVGTPTPTPTLTVTATLTPTVSAIPVNNSALLTLKMDAPVNGTGSLWSIDPRNYQRTQLISKNTVRELFSWSPDNSYLAFGVNSDNAVVLSFWDSKHGNELHTNFKVQSLSQTIWSSDSEFVWIDYSSSIAPQIDTISLPALTIKTDSLAPRLNAYQLSVSPNLNNVIFISPDLPGNPILLKRDISKQFDLTQLGILPSGDFDFGLWLDNKSYIFYNNSGIYVLDTNLFTVAQIVTLHSNFSDPFNSTNMVLSGDKDTIYFFYENSLYKYVFSTKISDVVYDFNNLLNSGDKISIAVTPNQRYVAVTINNKAQLLEVFSNKLQTLCENLCGETVIQN